MTPEQAARKFENDARDIRDGLEGMTIKAVLFVQQEIPSYPAAPPTSTYRRTGTLGRVITAFPGKNAGRSLGGGGGIGNGGTPLSRVQSLSNGAVGYIGGRLSYIPRVIDEDRQGSRWRHWWTLQGVLRGARDGIVKIYRAETMKILSR